MMKIINQLNELKKILKETTHQLSKGKSLSSLLSGVPSETLTRLIKIQSGFLIVLK